MMAALKPLRLFPHRKLEFCCHSSLGGGGGRLQMIHLYLGTYRRSLIDTLSQAETTKVRTKVRAAVVVIETIRII